MFRRAKIAAGGSGKRMARYQRDAANLAAPDRKLGIYYGGWDAMGTWPRSMTLGIAAALGIDRTQAPTEEGLARLFECRRADTGEKWTKEKREVSAVDLQAAAHKSFTLAVIGAKSEAERASLLQALWRANDYAMNAFLTRLGVARTGQGGKGPLIGGDAAFCSFLHFAARPTHPLQDGPNGKTAVKSLDLPSDPHIHIHNPVWNLLHCDDGKLRAIDGPVSAGRSSGREPYGGVVPARELMTMPRDPDVVAGIGLASAEQLLNHTPLDRLRETSFVRQMALARVAQDISLNWLRVFEGRRIWL